MKKIVPLNKDIKFTSNIAEITSIALDHDLVLSDYEVLGNLTISGSYKMTDMSINTEEFEYKIPVNIQINNNYDISDVAIDINDFYYEIIDNNYLSVNIEVVLNNLKDKPLIEEKRYEYNILEEIKEPIKEEKKEEIKLERMEVSEVKSLFDSFDDSKETYSSYKIWIVKEGDNIENICLKYTTTKETLELYNDLTDLKLGDKIIIPEIINDKI